MRRMKNEFTEAVEVCPWCCGENVFPNYDVSKKGYIVVCQHCKEEMMLCDECLHSDDNPHGNCDWHEDRHLPKSERHFGYCFRGTTKH